MSNLPRILARERERHAAKAPQRPVEAPHSPARASQVADTLAPRERALLTASRRLRYYAPSRDAWLELDAALAAYRE